MAQTRAIVKTYVRRRRLAGKCDFERYQKLRADDRARDKAYRRQYTPDLRSIKRKSIMPLRRLAVSGWRRFSRALICFSVYSRRGSMSWTMCLSTAPNFFRCIGSCRSEPSLLKKSLSTLE